MGNKSLAPSHLLGPLKLLFWCSFVHTRGLDGLEVKTRENMFQDMEAQFNLGSVGMNAKDKGLFGIS